MPSTALVRGRGGGAPTDLVDELVRRRPAGVTQIATTVTADNTASLAMLRRLGPTLETPTESPRVDVVVDLDAARQPADDLLR